MQHEKDDFPKDDKKMTTQPDKNKENDADDNFQHDEAMASRAEESGGTGDRRTAARDSVSGGWPTVPVIGPLGCVSLRTLHSLGSPLGR